MTFLHSMHHDTHVQLLQNRTTLLKLTRDREVIRQFRARFNSDMAAFRFRLELLRVMQAQKNDHWQNQPRDEDGRWTDTGAASRRPATDIGAIRPLREEGDGNASTGTQDTPFELIPMVSDQSHQPVIVPVAETDGYRYSISLHEEERLGGHTILRHVGLSDEELIQSLRSMRTQFSNGLRAFEYRKGTFTDAWSAEYFVNLVLKNNPERIDQVVKGHSIREEIDMRLGYETGREAIRDSWDEPIRLRKTYVVRVVIIPSRRAQKGYIVLTAFPVNQPIPEMRR